jgi:phosphatidate cytidylyltransferase
MSQHTTRITLGTVLVVAVGAILYGDVALARWTGLTAAPGFWVLLVAALVAGAAEFFRMLRARGLPAQPGLGLAFVVILVAAVFAETQLEPRIRPWLYHRGLEVYLLLIVGLTFAAFLAEIGRVERAGNDMGRALASVAWTVLGILTVGLLGVFLAKVRFLSPDPMKGLAYLVLTLGVAKGSDVGAYVVGSLVGRRKLVPTLSPSKTVEGMAGGLAAGIGAAIGIGVGWCGFAWWQMLIFGLAVATAGVLGDLAESLMKRGCGVKDSGRVPGFGGVLDIMDSMLAAGPVAYLLLVVLTGEAWGG